MSMTPKLWSISALAVELDMDRRTVAARLRNVRGDGQLNGSSAWHLTTALSALRGGRGGARAADGDGREDRVMDLVRMTHRLTLIPVPRTVAAKAVELGLPMGTAYELSETALQGVLDGIAELIGDTQLEDWKGRDRHFDPVDWQELRQRAGEPDWAPPATAPAWWQAPA